MGEWAELGSSGPVLTLPPPPPTLVPMGGATCAALQVTASPSADEGAGAAWPPLPSIWALGWSSPHPCDPAECPLNPASPAAA